MENNFIPIRKGLQKDVLYRGLKAKYIMYCLYLGLAAIILGLVLSTFIPMVLAMLAIVIAIAIIFLVLLFYSRTYGANGFVKKMADAAKPDSIKISNTYENLLLWKNK
ncbi:hypothetical protein MTsPCn5_08940 [Croceitalea sp. MTPC5]|jgi:chromate transport protein ChrA|nr:MULTISPECIES: DUF4133 domain-containing protein [Allomuricauda]GMN05506.1 hypothetical protein MTsPCn5_08940 [Croceitalea sp. MTPC5]MBO0340723.1 DUF4133 domain-containing protein [Allomuricauda profundi]MBO6589688.1 DUF4133 domain-containing protein [Allomuricauda sp.]MBO6619379.1 DUF4133 domain-containing protein [Allomuricauda sp.]MBO6645290.1 DUF4133 domain-containing protein [Allomuricauda sp.]|tara:strand:+ start:29195 stop:29518 length:324 start_codon:yes stop_codon:yes gene_type:complete